MSYTPQHSPTLQRWSGDVGEPTFWVHALRCLSALSVRLFLKTYHQLEIVGRENLPRNGSFVIVSNHTSHLDALCLLAAMPLARLDRTFPAAARDYFFVDRTRSRLATIFANLVPFDRRDHLRGSLQLCRRLLNVPGNALILFPEGTRSTTGDLNPFRPGVGCLVAGTDIPVVPCAIQGPFSALPKGRVFPRPAGLRLTIGEPRCFSKLQPCHESNERIATQLQLAVARLLCE